MRDLQEMLTRALPWPVVDVDVVTLRDDAVALEDLSERIKGVYREGNFFNSALSVVAHVARESFATTESVRLHGLLDDVETYHVQQLANIRAFRKSFEEQRNQEKLIGQADPNTSWPFPWARIPLAVATVESVDESLLYWRSLRDHLIDWFALSIEKLSEALGLSYATVANLGKRRPQGRTIRPVLTLHGLAKAYLDHSGDVARAWLASEGRDLVLRRDLKSFEDAVNARLFADVSVPRSGVTVEGEDFAAPDRWLPAVQSIPHQRAQRF